MTKRIALLAGLTAAWMGLTLGLSPRPEPAAPTPVPAAQDPDVFVVDTVHSSVVFRIGHLGVSNFYGRFNEVTGLYAFKPDRPDECSLNIQVKTASVDTANTRRDKHLKSGDFFDVAQFPEIRFTSSSVSKISDKTYEVEGEMDLHGVKKPLTVQMELIGIAQTPQGYKCGLETIFTIKRSDFGMETYVENGGLGDEVQLMVSLEGRRR